MKEKIELRVVSVFVFMLVVMAVVAFISIRSSRRSMEKSDWVNHTHAVILEASGLVASLNAGDSALRSFLLTGDKRDQVAYRAAYRAMVEHLQVAKASTRTEHSQHQKFLELEKLLGKRVDFTRDVVKTREQQGLEAASKALAADAGGEGLLQIGHVVDGLIQEENDLLKERDKQAYVQAQATRWTVIAAAVADVVLVLFAGWLIRDDIEARRRAAAVLAEANAQLEIKVQERTRELREANESLKKENLERRWSNQALDHQLRYNHLIINSIGELVFVISTALNISRINPAVIHQTKFEPKELVAGSIERVLDIPAEGMAETGRGASPLLIAMREGREIQDRTANLLTKTGRVPVRFSLVPLRDADKVVGGVMTMRLCNHAAPGAN